MRKGESGSQPHEAGMSRRDLMSGVAGSALAFSAPPFIARAAGQPQEFRLKYAPSLETFREHAGEDPIDNLKFMADEGFSAVFDNWFIRKPVALQDRITGEIDRLGLTMGPFVMYAEFKQATFVTQDTDFREYIVNRTREAVEVAKRSQAKWMLIAPGCCSQRLEWDYQTANLVDNLRRCVEIAEPLGMVIVIEPLNWWANHPGLFLQKIPQAYQICKAVNSPACKIADDLYHQQITEGNLIPNIDLAWSELATFHVGDNPGRKEPGTGEINYQNVFKHIFQKGYDGVLCMEHGQSKPGKEGERAVIEAYRSCDDFEI